MLAVKISLVGYLSVYEFFLLFTLRSTECTKLTRKSLFVTQAAIVYGAHGAKKLCVAGVVIFLNISLDPGPNSPATNFWAEEG